MTHPVLRIVGAPRALRRWAVASLVANIVLVVTGALVRLTGSGLGCPTWPRCTDDSYVTHPALGIHGVIEFGNRMLTFVLIVDRGRHLRQRHAPPAPQPETALAGRRAWRSASRSRRWSAGSAC